MTLEFRLGVIAAIRHPSQAAFISATIILFTLENRGDIRSQCLMRLLNFAFANLTPLVSDDQSEVSRVRKKLGGAEERLSIFNRLAASC